MQKHIVNQIKVIVERRRSKVTGTVFSEQECLYRHSKSRFIHGEDGLATPLVPDHISVPLSPRPSTKSRPQSRPLGVTRSEARAQSAKYPPRPPSSAQKPRVVKSAGTYRKSVTPVPVKAWATFAKATPLVLKPQAQSAASPGCDEPAPAVRCTGSASSSSSHSRAQSAPARQRTPPSAPPLTPAPTPTPSREEPEEHVVSAASRPSRAQSAQIPRSRERVKTRPVTSASAVRLAETVRYPRPFSPSPPPPDDRQHISDSTASHKLDVAASPAAERDDSPPQVTYEDQLKKYGWRMQVHGDPLNLK